MEEAKERCDNCQEEFPESKIGTHFAYCRRNIKRCPTCRQLYDINFQEQHEEEYHKQQNCPYCQRTFPSAQFTRHTNNCPKKPKYCQYCDLNVPVETYPLHLSQCESRTKPCTKCNKPITNKQYLIHLVSCTGPVEEYKPRNYQEHIQEQRRVIEHEYKRQEDRKGEDVRKREEPKREEVKREEGKRSYEVYRGSRDKGGVVVPQRDSRENKREEKQYIPISHTYQRGTSGITGNTGVTGGSRIPASQLPPPRQEIKPERREIYGNRQVRGGEVKDYRDKDFKQVKREQPRVYNKPINPPPTNFTYKREEPKPSRVVVPTTTSTRPAVREVKQHSNKDLFGEGVKPVIKTSISNERQVRPQERPKPVPLNPTRIPAPETKQRVIYQSQPRQVPPSEALLTEMALMQLSPEQREMQLAIMQSMGNIGKSSYSFQSQMENQSFIAQQRAIEQQLKKNRRKW